MFLLGSFIIYNLYLSESFLDPRFLLTSSVSTEVKLGVSLVIVSKKISQTDLGRGLWTAET